MEKQRNLIKTGECGDNLTWELYDNGELIISGTGGMKDYYFDDPAPWSPTSVTSVIIASGITSIGDFAFEDCSALKSVTIPDSVTSIGYKAFIRCSALERIVVDSKNTVFDSRENCNAIIETASNTLIVGCRNATIPDSVTSIGDRVFEGCSALESITIPDSVTSIGDYAFARCSSLESITIPDSVTSIGYKAFEGCTNLPIVGNIRYADSCAVEAVDKSLTGFTFIEGTRFIGDSAFSGCSALKSVTIPKGVTSMGDWAFCGSSALKSVTIPDTVSSIGSTAFAGCSTLESVTIPGSVTSIGNSAFDGCYALESVRCMAITPPSADCLGIPNQCVLKVPAESLEAYRHADGWIKFQTIIPITDEE